MILSELVSSKSHRLCARSNACCSLDSSAFAPSSTRASSSLSRTGEGSCHCQPLEARTGNTVKAEQGGRYQPTIDKLKPPRNSSKDDDPGDNENTTTNKASTLQLSPSGQIPRESDKEGTDAHCSFAPPQHELHPSVVRYFTHPLPSVRAFTCPCSCAS